MNDLCWQAVTTGRIVLQSAGLQRRDFVPLTDACRAIAHLLELEIDARDDGVFNVGGARSSTVSEMAEIVRHRVEMSTGHRPGMFLPEKTENELVKFLDYKIDKLVDSGFAMKALDSVNQEIDGLIQFCSKHA